jgi:hypothetical protein
MGPPSMDFLKDFYHNPTTFEQALTRHGWFRFKVASHWAALEGRDFVPAKDLFCGSICTPKFAGRKFKPSFDMEYITTPVKGVWCRNLAENEVPNEMEFQDNSPPLELSRPKLFALHTGLVNNAFDGVQAMDLKQLENKCSRALLWLDTKHGQFGNQTNLPRKEIKELLEKRGDIQRKRSEYLHLVRVATPKPVTEDSYQLLENENEACLISNTDDGLAWALSPTMAYLFVDDGGQK